MSAKGDVTVRRNFDAKKGQLVKFGVAAGVAFMLAGPTAMAADGVSTDPIIPDEAKKVERSEASVLHDPRYPANICSLQLEVQK